MMRSLWPYVFALCMIYCDAFPNNNHEYYHHTTHSRRSVQMPSNIKDLRNGHLKKAFRDVSDTIAEVQKFLEKDPTLPRLTRGEIEELFEKVTQEEYEKSIMDGNMNRAVHMKSLMLVLPYNTNNNYSDTMLEEFYTRPPITKIVNVETKTPSPTQIVYQPTVANSFGVQPIPSKNSFITTYKPVPGQTKITTFGPLPTGNEAQNPAPYPTLEMELNHALTEPDVEPSKLTSLLATPSFTYPALPTTISAKATKKYPPKLSPFKSQLPTQPFGNPINDPNPKMTPEIADLLRSIGLLTNEKLPPHMTQEEFQPIQYAFQHNFNPTTFAPATEPISIRRRLNTGPDQKANDFESFKPLPRVETTSETIDNELAALLQSYGILGAAGTAPNSRGKKSFDNDQAKIIDQNEIIQTQATEYMKVPDINANLIQGLAQLTAKFQRTAPLSSSVSPSRVTQPQQETKTTAIANQIKDKDDLNDDRLSLLTDDLESIENLPIGPGVPKLTFKRQSSESSTENDTNISTTTEGKQTEPLKVNLDLTGSTASTNSTIVDKIDNESDDDKDDDKDDDSKPAIIESELNSGEQRAKSTAATTTETIDKFGAKDLDPVTEEPLPPPRRNGFYFFSDWNSFLEVGEEPDQVVVRFDPKVGDPSRFVQVKIP